MCILCEIPRKNPASYKKPAHKHGCTYAEVSFHVRRSMCWIFHHDNTFFHFFKACFSVILVCKCRCFVLEVWLRSSRTWTSSPSLCSVLDLQQPPICARESPQSTCRWSTTVSHRYFVTSCITHEQSSPHFHGFLQKIATTFKLQQFCFT
jgi:hypothetical protein